jgi:hypothetical protein
MKWAYSIQQKFKAAALLGLICAVIIVTNLLGRHNIDELGTSFSSVYEDRLLVESYIYELADHLYRKKLMLDNCAGLDAPNLRSEISNHNAAIATLLSDYEKTRLTEQESACFIDFKNNVAALQYLELQYLRNAGDDIQLAETRSRIDDRFALASKNLHQLSGIQISEGKLLNDQSKKIVAGSSLITNLEMVILICIAILLQVLVIASRPVIPRIRQEGSLN